MIRPTPPTDQKRTIGCDEETSEQTASTCFREIMRTLPVEALDPDLKDRECLSSYLAPLPSLFTLIGQDKEESEEEKTEILSTQISRELLFASSQTNASQIAAITDSSFAASSPIWQAILESASQGISHTLAEELTETTLTLDGPRFMDTPLAGTKLTVREFSTAPLSFNVHFACVPAGLAYLQPQLKILSTLFRSRRYPFSIHSIDADLGDGVPPPIERDRGNNQDQQQESR